MIAARPRSVHGDRGHQRRRRSSPRRPRRRSRPARPRCPQPSPGSTRGRPRRSAAATRTLVLTTWPAAPAATPTSGPPSRPASTIVGVDAVYQLRGPSWTEMRSANTGATTSTSRSGSETVGPIWAGNAQTAASTSAIGGKASATTVPRVDRRHRSTVEEARRDGAAAGMPQLHCPRSLSQCGLGAADIPRARDSVAADGVAGSPPCRLRDRRGRGGCRDRATAGTWRRGPRRGPPLRQPPAVDGDGELERDLVARRDLGLERLDERERAGRGGEQAALDLLGRVEQQDLLPELLGEAAAAEVPAVELLQEAGGAPLAELAHGLAHEEHELGDDLLARRLVAVAVDHLAQRPGVALRTAADHHRRRARSTRAPPAPAPAT